MQDENQAKQWNKFVNNNFDIIVLYALLNIKNPLDGKINNFQRFVLLYKYNNTPKDVEGFVIPYCFFEAVEAFAAALERCIRVQAVLEKFESEKE